jgi:MFS family permease
MVAGWLADRFNKQRLLAAGYFLGALMALDAILLPMNFWTLVSIFVIGGIYVAMEETLEDSFCAELVGGEHHGMAFGTLATVNGVGDFASSLVVGLLWTAFGTPIAFAYSAVLFVSGGCLILRSAATVRAKTE